MPNISQQLQQQLSFEFSANTIPIQIEMINNEPLFLAKDICDALELENVTKALYVLDDDEKLTLPVDRAGQARNMNFVTESGLYSLVFQSRKAEAKKFRKWVTNEVLPSIRKTGSYGKNKLLPQPPQIDELLTFVHQIEHDGQILYAGKQVLTVLGKLNGCSCNKLYSLGAKGLAYKIAGIPGGQVKWYIPRKAIGVLLNVKPTSIANISILKTLKQGGLL